jgi:hypothetical protein
MRSSDWQYLGYVVAGVGISFAFSGAIALFGLQQGIFGKTQYASSLVWILFFGVLLAVLGVAAFFVYLSRNKIHAPSPPPFPDLPPPPP